MKLFIVVTLAIVSQALGQLCEPDINCKRPDCSCFSQDHPIKDPKKAPQLVMLTFDDGVSTANMDFYRKLLFQNRKNKNGCLISATFFVTHEYNNYQFLHDLRNQGCEIALHSITHNINQDYWRTIDAAQWEKEMMGLRAFISAYARIPASEIVGMRAPFLQVGGDEMFKMVRKFGLYDSSMAHIRERNFDPPIFPYTLNYGYESKCLIEPCPHDNYNGTWIIPMNMLFQTQTVEDVGEIDFPCSMADACAPPPDDADKTYDYFKRNFEEEFYNGNRAPFPLFLHEAWLKTSDRAEGYLRFVDYLLKKPDVFIVPIKEVIEYMKNPQPLDKYTQKYCLKSPMPRSCLRNTCEYKTTPLGGPRIMPSCSKCPATYPWI